MCQVLSQAQLNTSDPISSSGALPAPRAPAAGWERDGSVLLSLKASSVLSAPTVQSFKQAAIVVTVNKIWRLIRGASHPQMKQITEGRIKKKRKPLGYYSVIILTGSPKASFERSGVFCFFCCFYRLTFPRIMILRSHSSSLTSFHTQGRVTLRRQIQINPPPPRQSGKRCREGGEQDRRRETENGRP